MALVPLDQQTTSGSGRLPASLSDLLDRVMSMNDSSKVWALLGDQKVEF